jgi:hypothetical protein
MTWPRMHAVPFPPRLQCRFHDACRALTTPLSPISLREMRAFVLLAIVALACADTLTVGNIRISAFDGMATLSNGRGW